MYVCSTPKLPEVLKHLGVTWSCLRRLDDVIAQSERNGADERAKTENNLMQQAERIAGNLSSIAQHVHYNTPITTHNIPCAPID